MGKRQAASHLQAPRLLSTPRLALHPFCSHSYLRGGLGRWILQVSDPAAPYLDGLAQEWRAPLGVGEVCRHGGWLCPSLRHPGCRVETRKPQGDAKSPKVHSAAEGGGMEGSGCHCLGGALLQAPSNSLQPLSLPDLPQPGESGPSGRASPTHCPTEALGMSPELLARLRQLPASTMPGPRKPTETCGVLTLGFSE